MIFIVLSRQNRSLPKSVRPDRFWQKKPAKSGPPGPLLLPKSVRPDQFWQPKLVPLANFGPPGGPILARSYLPKSVPPVYYFLYYTIELSH